MRVIYSRYEYKRRRAGISVFILGIVTEYRKDYYMFYRHKLDARDFVLV